MKLSNSKRQLADIIRASGEVWAGEYVVATQDGTGHVFTYYKDATCIWSTQLRKWQCANSEHYTHIASGEPIAQCHRTKLTRDEYMAYLAEFESEVEKSAIPKITATVEPCAIPSIDHQIFIWKEAKAATTEAREKLARLEQHERDAHAAVNARLLEVGWGSAANDYTPTISDDGRVAGFVNPKRIEDLRDGDIVEITGSINSYWEKMKGINSVIRFDYDGDCIAHSTTGGGAWRICGGTTWKFISRP